MRSEIGIRECDPQRGHITIVGNAYSMAVRLPPY